MRKLIIAVDGFSSCGKSTMAKALAKTLGYTYIDSGAMYRALSLYCLRNGLMKDGSIDEPALMAALDGIEITFEKNAEGVSQTYLNGENVENEIRNLEVSNAVSIVSAVGFVRKALVALQRKLSVGGGVVMDGRDIGTVVFPNADLKLFVTADAKVRAKRRYEELVEKGQPEDFEAILANIEWRDKLDQTRAVSPLKKADDAVVLDNGNMTIEEQDAWLLEQVNRKIYGNY
ncbi:MAG: (d)CMP kinase [Bacteroidales bacterium]|nr:(d)CMP kinase [Bacteroidales bacterium]MDD4713264.1 (d)CMP kinase [Bacteroidales bacterium]